MLEGKRWSCKRIKEIIPFSQGLLDSLDWQLSIWRPSRREIIQWPSNRGIGFGRRCDLNARKIGKKEERVENDLCNWTRVKLTTQHNSLNISMENRRVKIFSLYNLYNSLSDSFFFLPLFSSPFCYLSVCGYSRFDLWRNVVESNATSSRHTRHYDLLFPSTRRKEMKERKECGRLFSSLFSHLSLRCPFFLFFIYFLYFLPDMRCRSLSDMRCVLFSTCFTTLFSFAFLSFLHL